MAESAVHAEFLNVGSMRECDGLVWAFVEAKDDWLPKPRGNYKRESKDYDNKRAKACNAKKTKAQQLFAGRLSVLKIAWYQI